MKEFFKFFNTLLDIISKLILEYNKAQREKKIEKIKENPNKAWEERFGGKNG